MARGKRATQKEFWEKMKKDPAIRRKTFEKLLAHVRAGLSLSCFSDMSLKSVEECLEKYPEEFCSLELQCALRDGQNYWENLGKMQANGSCMGNSRSWYYNMSNRYGWSDKQDIKAEHSGSMQVQVVSYSSQKDQRKDP